ncbi:PREDICTED: zinc finger protein 184-like [Gekko japonicus]|uniref:Zinc finger protein 184-like n=1 Tax=Gekko japonicus TaxID=146911 RepID=A0ABM1K5Q8_GEKJA|nr:PREDICTED: zinc finger protein 184-like [Gekko japonicus]
MFIESLTGSFIVESQIVAPPLQLQPGFPLQKSELLARLEQGQEAWTPEVQNSNEDTEENPVKLQQTGWSEPGTWWNSYRSPISVPSSDSSSSDNESSSEKEEEKNVKQECLRITKPRAALLGRCEVKQEGCEPWQSERLGQPQGSMRMPLCWTREKDRGLVKSRKGKRGADPGKDLFVCPQCGNSFNRKSSLKRHLATIHDTAKPYEWPPRRKTFLEKSNRGTRARRHMRTSRLGREPYECPECGESFMTSTSFTQHQRSHSGEATYQCPACDNLIKHLMTAHSGAHLSNCPDCGKAFLREGDLTMHRAMIHGGESFHQCLDCGKCYQEKLSLIRHQTLHAKKGPYKCPDCEMTFADSRRLANHSRIHKTQKLHKYLDQEGSDTEEYVHTCPDCGECFKTEQCFVNHQRTHMKEQQCQQPDKGDNLKGGTQKNESHVEMQCSAESAGRKPLGAGLTQPKVEMEETLHTCPDCGKFFRDSQCFANHRSMHIKEETSGSADGPETVEERKLPHAGQQEGQMKENPYQCCSCGKTYASQYNLNRHQRIHADSRPYKCTICGKTFTYRYTLLHHEATHTEGKTCLHNCSYCGKGFTTKTSLSRHLQLHVMGRPYQCGVCGKAFAYRYSLTQHQETHMEGQAQKCLFCYKVFRTKHSLSRHKRIHMETRSYQCSVCGKAFGTKYSFCRHQDGHLNGSLRRSSSSRKGLIDASALAKDQASDTDENSNNWSESSTLSGHHGEETPAQCSKGVGGSLPAKGQSVHREENPSKGLDVKESPSEFSKRVDSDILTKQQNTQLKEHSMKGLDGAETPRGHSVVTKEQGSHAEGNVHEGTYSLVSPRQQGACTGDSLPKLSEKREGFTASLTLTKHQNIHVGVNSIPGLNSDQPCKGSSTRSGLQGVTMGKRQYVCSHCGKSCRDRYSLKRHERTHTSERPYQCQKCGKRFRETKNLIRHQLTHTDLRPYPCTECGKYFKSKSSLDKHQNVHKKPFSCPFCGKRVTTSSILKNHLRTHTGEKPFKCTQCGKDYKTKAALNKHKEGHFKENSSEVPKVDQSNQIF